MTAKKTATTTRSRARRTTKKASSRAEELTASARDLAGQVQGAATRLVDKVPDIEGLPKNRRTRLASVSVAVGAALWLLGAPRILTLLAWIPALFVGGTQAAKGLGRR